MIITRFHELDKIELEVEFLTPTFLGGADQNAELRSAPFKNLLRQWWRVANGHLNVDELRRKEGDLFGTVYENRETKENPNSSRVRLSIVESNISFYDKKDIQFPKIGINHTEVNNRFIPIEVYLGMGPIFWNKEKKINEYNRTSIKPKSTCKILIKYPKEEESVLVAVQLIQDFGAIGSRCRNGWGSLSISTSSKLKSYVIGDFDKVMADNKKYPHFLAKENGEFLAWETKPQLDFMNAWQILAKAYLDLRTSQIMKDFGDVGSVDNKNKEFVSHKSASARHLLGYPITHHKVDDESWGENPRNFSSPKKIEGRLASPIRLVIKMRNGKFVGRLLHIPYSIHMNFKYDQTNIWRNVYKILDERQDLCRMRTEVK